jgi:hypothetical protein
MKRRRHGCLPSQTSARAMAERLSLLLLLYCCCRHPLQRNVITGHERVERRRALVSGVLGLAGLVRCKLIGNAEKATQTGPVRIAAGNVSSDSS